MSPDEKKILEEVAALARENHQILKRLQRARRWGRFFWFLKWLIIIGLTVWLYNYLQPLINQLFTTYKTLSTGIEGIKKAGQSLPDLPQLPGLGDINKILEGLKGGGGQ